MSEKTLVLSQRAYKTVQNTTVGGGKVAGNRTYTCQKYKSNVSFASTRLALVKGDFVMVNRPHFTENWDEKGR